LNPVLGRLLSLATIACLVGLGVAATPASAETAVGAEAYVAVGGHELSAGFEQLLQSALDTQFVGVEVAIVRGRLVLSGFVSPGVHTAVVAVVAHLLQNPVYLPVAVDIATPSLGLGLPFLAAGTGVEIPDLSAILDELGVVDKLRTR
jgi:hypothetical protein